MSARWSNPSGGLGINRFRVWPLSSDSYNHTDNANNWDMADDIIGVPASGTWPPTLGVGGGIYREINLLQQQVANIGDVKMFFKPNDNYPLQAGWVPLDGRTLGPSQHDFIGGGTITLPDYRGVFPLGADFTKSIGTSAAAVGASTIDNASGAPGPQATGGSNQHTLVVSEMPSHNHGGGDHTHTINRQVLQLNQAGLNYLVNVRDQITNTEVTNGSGQIINTQGGGVAHENRPRWIGTIFICYVKKPTTVV